MADDSELDTVLTEVGPRLKRLRHERGATLAELARVTGISVSTLLRLESGQRRPSLELLLPIASAHQVPLDDLVGAPPAGDPRVRLKPQRRGDLTIVPLTRAPGGLHAFKTLIPATRTTPDPKPHEGYEWFYVLNGRLRLVLADQDVILRQGEAAEFDTRLPHWSGSTGDGPVEILSIFGSQGERMHLRSRARERPTD